MTIDDEVNDMPERALQALFEIVGDDDWPEGELNAALCQLADEADDILELTRVRGVTVHIGAHIEAMWTARDQLREHFAAIAEALRPG